MNDLQFADNLRKVISMGSVFFGLRFSRDLARPAPWTLMRQIQTYNILKPTIIRAPYRKCRELYPRR
jgi:hypothetical protein